MKTKLLTYSVIFVVTSGVALLVVASPWLAYATVGALFVLAVLAFSASPTESGHIVDNAVTYVIIAIILLLLCGLVGSKASSGDETKSNAEPAAATDASSAGGTGRVVTLPAA